MNKPEVESSHTKRGDITATLGPKSLNEPIRHISNEGLVSEEYLVHLRGWQGSIYLELLD